MKLTYLYMIKTSDKTKIVQTYRIFIHFAYKKGDFFC
jgi:hypothetical protein